MVFLLACSMHFVCTCNENALKTIQKPNNTMTLDQETSGSTPDGAALKGLKAVCFQTFFILDPAGNPIIFLRNEYEGNMDFCVNTANTNFENLQKRKFTDVVQIKISKKITGKTL
jgi:hypothetical protein